jgi:voltage-gated potassium channel
MPPRSNPAVDPSQVVRRRLLFTVALLVLITVTGTIGFKVLSLDPNSTWIDALFMTVTTMTTVGYGEIVPLGQGGRLFVIMFLWAGFAVVSYGAVEIGQWIFSAEMRNFLEKVHMDKEIQKLRGHFIVCGFGRMGWTICEHLRARNKSFVVIDTDETTLRAGCSNRNWLFVVGDASDDQVLMQAGITRARALATVLPTDADNVYVALTARLLSSKLEIIARASDDEAKLKLERAGANRVVSPYSTGAQKIARFMLNPNIEDFLEIADQRGQDLELADVQISADSPYVGKKLMETDLRELGVMIVGIRRRNGERLMPPPGNAVIEAGDCLFAFGSATAVNRMIGESGNGDEVEAEHAGGQSIEIRN